MLIPSIIILILIALNGIFVAAEFSIVAASKARLTRIAAGGSKTAKKILGIVTDPKLQNRYTGRKKDSHEDPLRFLSKPKNKKATELLKKGYKNVEVSGITGIHVNTVTKIKRIMIAMN